MAVDLLAGENLAGQNLLSIVSRGSAIVAELLVCERVGGRGIMLRIIMRRGLCRVYATRAHTHAPWAA